MAAELGLAHADDGGGGGTPILSPTSLADGESSDAEEEAAGRLTPLAAELSPIAFSDEDDEGSDGYKPGGYHPVKVGEVYNQR